MLNSLKLNKLYEEVYEPKLLPQDLLKNLNSKNYISVNFTQQGLITIALTKCYLPNGEVSTYRYEFKNSKLINLEDISNNKIITLYNRKNEIVKLKQQLISDSYFSTVS